MPRVCWEVGGLHYISTYLWKYDAVFPPAQETRGRTCICIYADTVMLLCLHNILPTFSVYVKSATSSSWGISFFAKAKQTLTQDIQPMLFQCWASVPVVGPPLRN